MTSARINEAARVIDAAIEAASRSTYETVVDALVAGGVIQRPKMYDKLSERVRRIRTNQIRPAIEAAYPVIAAAVQADVEQRFRDVLVEAPDVSGAGGVDVTDWDRGMAAMTRMIWDRCLRSESVSADVEPTA